MEGGHQGNMVHLFISSEILWTHEDESSKHGDRKSQQQVLCMHVVAISLVLCGNPNSGSECVSHSLPVLGTLIRSGLVHS